MGLFDFLKPQRTMTAHEPQIPSTRNECDISKTNTIIELFKIPRVQRDDKWNHVFYENVLTASFASATPQVLTGPDGFPYFILRTPQVNVPFESFCIQNMKDDFLLNRGWGVVFNPAEDKTADWVFTHGNILNLHLNNRFFTPVNADAIENIEFTKTVGVLKKAEQVMIAQPSETYLPYTTRRALKAFLQSKGIRKPKIMMLSSLNQGKITRKLAFNISPGDYPVISKLDYLMQQIGWFLPNDYLIIPLAKNSDLAKGFNEL